RWRVACAVAYVEPIDMSLTRGHWRLAGFGGGALGGGGWGGGGGGALHPSRPPLLDARTGGGQIPPIFPRSCVRVCVLFGRQLPDTADKCLKNGGRCRD